ncbi:MAG: hypothetical protein PUD59_01340 [bacterium]|nr:hypothetical protein [bacterium]
MEFIKKNKITVFVIILFIVITIGLYFAYGLFFSNSGKPVYGDRLDGIEEVEISSDLMSKMETSIKENKNVKETSTNVSGRTLNIIITVLDELSINEAKKIGESSYKELSEQQIKYYSIQIFIKKDSEEQNNFPIIGYKQKESTSISWTKDRKVETKNESE